MEVEGAASFGVRMSLSAGERVPLDASLMRRGSLAGGLGPPVVLVGGAGLVAGRSVTTEGLARASSTLSAGEQRPSAFAARVSLGAGAVVPVPLGMAASLAAGRRVLPRALAQVSPDLAAGTLPPPTLGASAPLGAGWRVVTAGLAQVAQGLSAGELRPPLLGVNAALGGGQHLPCALSASVRLEGGRAPALVPGLQAVARLEGRREVEGPAALFWAAPSLRGPGPEPTPKAAPVRAPVIPSLPTVILPSFPELNGYRYRIALSGRMYEFEIRRNRRDGHLYLSISHDSERVIAGLRVTEGWPLLRGADAGLPPGQIVSLGEGVLAYVLVER